MKDQIILFDLDHTLFNTNLFIKKVDEHFQIDSVKIFEGNDVQGKKELVSDMCNTKDIYHGTLFSDVKRVLELLVNDFTLGIYSQGIEQFQRTKIENTGIIDYVSPELVFISANKTAESVLKNIPVNAIIVDDNPTIINALIEAKVGTPIFIDRYNRNLSLGIEEIESLVGLPNVLASIND